MCDLIGALFGGDDDPAPVVTPAIPAPDTSKAAEGGQKERQRRAGAIGRRETIASNLNNEENRVRRKTALGA